MRVIPELTDAELDALPSAAEAKIYREFVKDTSPGTEGWLVVHSLGLANHDRKPYAEMDFLVLTPERYVGLEVKGGRVSCHDGRWTFTDRNGHTNQKPESPIDQAKGAVFALRDFLRRKIPVTYFKFGFASVFPDIDTSASPFGTEWGEIPIYSRKDMAHPISAFVNRVLSYWAGKHAGFCDISPYHQQLIKDLILPDFDLKPVRWERYIELEKTINCLTEQQYKLLGFAKDIPRFAVRGPAGSGKTFLALEDCHRLANSGRSVLYICSREDFKRYVEDVLIPNRFVGLKNDDRFHMCSNEQLPSKDARFDAIVVDEAQDFMDNGNFLKLLEHMKGGAANGLFHIYFDDRQVVRYSSFDQNFLPWLKAEYGFVPLELSHNCRNVGTIVDGTTFLTGVDAGTPLVTSSPGDPVQTFKYDTPASLVADISVEVARLLHPDEDLKVSDIVVLAEAKSVCNVLMALKVEWPNLRVFQSADFKGMEAEYAICVLGDEDGCFNELESYVGMTRAKKGLSIYLTAKTVDSAREKMARRNAAGRA